MKLEPVACPFCGGKNITVGQGSTFRWRMAMCDCGAQCGEIRIRTMGEGTREDWEAQAEHDAIEEWNKRAIPEGYVMVSAEHVLSKSELTQIDIWRDGAQDRYCYDPPKSEIDLQTKLEAMIAAKEQQ